MKFRKETRLGITARFHEIDLSKIIIENIKIFDKRIHLKASEVYVDVVFYYPKEDISWEGSVPIEYRRTGVHARTKEEITKLLTEAYKYMTPDPTIIKKWIENEDKYWASRKALITQEFYHVLKDSKWKCQQCELPANPNWARRVQKLKEAGYTLATNTKKFCATCSKKTTHLILLKLPRGTATSYETFSLKLRKRIIKVLGKKDVYEDKVRNHLLPDHKFSEIRWDEETREENPDDMSEKEIKEKFQLLSNQRNQQKREVCRQCSQTGIRSTLFGIKFYYEGDEKWPVGIPTKGKEAERGCVGCGWYDLDKWRNELEKREA